MENTFHHRDYSAQAFKFFFMCLDYQFYNLLNVLGVDVAEMNA